MSSPSQLNDHSDGGTTFHFTTDCNHYGTVRPVRATSGAKKGQWFCKILGPKVTSLSGIKTVYCEPGIITAQYAIGKYLRIQASTVHMRSERDMSVYNSPTKSTSSSQTVEDMPVAIVSPHSDIKSELASLHHYDYASLMAKATSHGKDIWEKSPNRLAKCKACGEKILKDQERIGKWTHNEYYHRSYHVYYHADCASDTLKASLHLKNTLDEDVKRQDVLHSRMDLRERLRRLRMSFATSLNVEPYRIFNDATLDDITAKLPTTKSELVCCNGIKEKKFRNFGSAILEVTNMYKRKKAEAGDGIANKSFSGSNNANGDESDDDVAVIGTLSCDEIVRRKIEHAAANGYIIEL